MSDKIPFGGDPEVFVQTQNGVIACPVALLKEPKKVVKVGNHGGFNRDGMAFELNPAPSTSPEEVMANMLKLLTDGILSLSKAGLGITKKIGVDIQAIPIQQALDLPNDVWELGCEPDYDAYSGQYNIVNVDPRIYTKRFAGGHITMQIGALPFADVCEVVKLFDYHAGLYSIRWSDLPDSIERRRTYGRAGAFRYHHENGIVEYRTPDAGWLWNNGYVEMCNRMAKAFQDFQSGVRLTNPSTIIRAINECDKETAQKIIS